MNRTLDLEKTRIKEKVANTKLYEKNLQLALKVFIKEDYDQSCAFGKYLVSHKMKNLIAIK